MGRFAIGALLGAAVGAGVTWLVQVDDATREELLERTDELAAGRTNPLRLIQKNLELQRERLQEAIEVGKRAAEARQRELWSELELPEPEEADEREAHTPTV